MAEGLERHHLNIPDLEPELWSQLSDSFASSNATCPRKEVTTLIKLSGSTGYKFPVLKFASQTCYPTESDLRQIGKVQKRVNRRRTEKSFGYKQSMTLLKLFPLSMYLKYMSCFSYHRFLMKMYVCMFVRLYYYP